MVNDTKGRARTRVYDPEKAALAAAARHSARSYARSIVRDWPSLTDEKRAEVRAILAPVVGRVAEGAR